MLAIRPVFVDSRNVGIKSLTNLIKSRTVFILHAIAKRLSSVKNILTAFNKYNRIGRYIIYSS